MRPYGWEKIFRDCARFGFFNAKMHNLSPFYLFFWVFFVSLGGVLPYFVSAKLFDNKFSLKRKLLLESLLLCFTASMITRPGVAGAVLQTPLLLIDGLRCQVSHVSCNFLCVCVFGHSGWACRRRVWYQQGLPQFRLFAFVKA